jgi:hypothetical protein
MEPQRAVRWISRGLLAAASFTIASALALAQGAAPEPAAPATPPPTATQPAPAEAPAPPELVSEPPGAGSAGAFRAQEPAAPLTSDWLVRDLGASDLAITFFALVVAIFAWRVGAGMSGLRGAAQRHTDESRRILEAAETAAEAARRSAESAEQALGVLRENAERQLRAYVTVKQFVQAAAQNVQGSLIQVVWQNTGATPTKGFRYWAMLREFDATIPEDFEFTPPGLRDYAGGELGSSATVSSPPLFVAAQTIVQMREGGRRVLLLGQASYGDFGGPHAPRETRFCFEVVPSEESGPETPPFNFVYYPRHNHIT